MSRFRLMAGAAICCIAVIAAVNVAGASAAQRAYTCTKAVPHQFSDEHCVTASGTGEYGHELIVNKEEGGKKIPTAITATNEKTASATTASSVAKLKGALSGVVTEVQCTKVHGTGGLTNGASSVSGTGKITYSECSVTAPSGKGCKVTGGTITTAELSATTEGQATNRLLFKPASGTEFASVPIEGCSITALNNTFPVTGELTATTNGATTSTEHTVVTEQNKLKFGGVKAGLEGAITISMEGGNPITLT